MTSIGSSAFSGCDNLITVHFNARSCTGSFFEKKTSIKEITFGNNVTTIPAFFATGCSGLSSITIGENVTSISNYAFNDCTSLTSITIPNGVTTIESYTFSGCSSLKEVTIGEGVIGINETAFNGCDNLNTVHFNARSCTGSSTFKEMASIKEMTFGDNVTRIPASIASGCSGLSSVTIGKNVTSIGKLAFSGCSNLTSITIPDGVTSIGSSAFSDCSSLMSITIPDGVTSIGGSAFSGCDNLNTVHFYVKNYTGSSPFIGKTSIKEMTFGNNVTTIPEDFASGCSGLSSVIIGDNVTSIGSSAFEGCSSLTSITIPDGVTTIGERTFRDCSSLKELTIGEGVTSIGGSAFSGCSNLRSIEIGENVKLIESGAFANTFCEYVKCLAVIPPVLAADAFGDNYDVSKLYIMEVPVNSTVAYATADNWKKCNTIYSVKDGVKYYPIIALKDGKEMLTVTDGKGVVTELPEGATAYVKKNANANLSGSRVVFHAEDVTDILQNREYEITINQTHTDNTFYFYSFEQKNTFDVALENGGELIDKITIENLPEVYRLKIRGKVNGTDILTIRKMTSLQFLDLKEAEIIDGGESYYETYTTSANQIGAYFFSGNSNLKEVFLPNSITTIGDNAFPSNVTSICLPPTVANIGRDALSYIDRLFITDLSAYCKCNFKDGIHGHLLFLNGKMVTDIVIPDDVTTIPDYAFYNCRKISSVTLHDKVTHIGIYAFYKISDNGYGQFESYDRYYGIIKEVNSMNTTPPEIEENTFSNKIYENATLYVPTGCRNIYWLHPGWEKFINIKEKDFSTGIENPANQGNEQTFELADGQIRFNKDGEAVYIYGADGALVYKGVSKRGQTVDIPSGGIYVVKVGDTSVKVNL